MKYTQLIASVTKILFAYLFLFLSLAQAEEKVQLSGRALFSFAPGHYLLETEKYIYEISKMGLPLEIREQFDSASSKYELISVEVPRSTVEYLWPNQAYQAQASVANKYNLRAQQLRSEAVAHGGQISLKGSSTFSFENAVFMVQINDTIFQIKKRELNSEQVAQLANAGVGARIEISIPKRALDAVWSFKAPADREVASAIAADGVSYTDGEVRITGTILYSFDDPLVLVQCNDIVYQIQKNRIHTSTPSALENFGSKVELTVPLEAIKFVWAVPPKGMAFTAEPVGLR